MVSVALGAFVNEPAIFPIRTTPFVIAPASTDPLLDMSELKSLCSFLSHSVKKGLSKSKIVGSFLRGRYNVHIVATVLHQHRPTMTLEPWPSVDANVRHTKPIPSLTPSKPPI